MIAKLIIQKLWQAKLSWDEAIPQNLYTEWVHFLKDLSFLKNIKIPRHVLCTNYDRIEMHVFCDASEVAYGVCIYLRSKSKAGNFKSNLLTSKSKVAPLKNNITSLRIMRSITSRPIGK